MLSQFDIGFELEAYYVGDLPPDQSVEYISNVIRKYLPEENIVLKSDESLPLIFFNDKEDNQLSGECRSIHGFEFASSIYQFTIENIIKISKFLENLPEYDIITTEHCGFHVHFSYNRMKRDDAVWILSKIVLDPEVFENLKYFEGIPFWDENYADTTVLELLRTYILKKDYNQIKKIINNDKFRLLRLHPQGTVEWRGPRNFLNLGRKKINRFLMKLFFFMTQVREIIDSDKILDMTKKEYLRSLGYSHMYVYSNSEFLFGEENKFKKLLEKVEKNKNIIGKIQNEKIQKRIIYHYPESVFYLKDPPVKFIYEYTYKVEYFKKLDPKYQTIETVKEILKRRPRSIIYFYGYLNIKDLNEFFKNNSLLWINSETMLSLIFKLDHPTLYNSLFLFLEERPEYIDKLIPRKNDLEKIIRKKPELFKKIKNPFKTLYSIVYDYNPALLFEKIIQLRCRADFIHFMESKGYNVRYKKQFLIK